MERLERLPQRMWSAALEAAERRFPRDNRYGVIGVGIDERMRAGRRLKGQWTLVALVGSKLRRARAAVVDFDFRFDGQKFRIAMDVRGTGHRHARAHDSGPSMYTGLHAGGRIVSGGRNGGVGCLVTTGGAQPTHLITCGHLFEVEVVGAKVYAADHEKPFVVGSLVANLLDRSVWSAISPVARDAALVELNDAGVQLAIETADRVSFDGVVDLTGQGAIDVQAFLPTAHDFSYPTRMGGTPYSFPAMQSDARGAYEVSDVLRTDQAVTVEGDSGTILLTTDKPRSAVGTLIGAIGSAMSLFEPLILSGPLLQRALGRQIDPWVP